MSPMPGGQSRFASAGGGPVFQDANGNRIFAKSGTDRFSDRQSDGELGAAIHNMLRGDVQNSSDRQYRCCRRVSDEPRNVWHGSRPGTFSTRLYAELEQLHSRPHGDHIAKVDSDATAQWRGETVEVTSSSLGFGRIVLQSENTGSNCARLNRKCSKMRQTGYGTRGALAATLGQKLDAAGLYGTGTGAEPLGLKYSGDVNTVTSVGTPTAGLRLTPEVLLGKNIWMRTEQFKRIVVDSESSGSSQLGSVIRFYISAACPSASGRSNASVCHDGNAEKRR